MSTTYKSIVYAKQVVCVAGANELYKVGDDMNNLHIIDNGAIVIGHDGVIVAVGPRDEIDSQYKDATFEETHDYPEQSIIPGFVDAHTHPVWCGDRVHEFKMKLAGATYLDIHKAGGGIQFTVNHSKAAKKEGLYKALLPRLDKMLQYGTTLVEAKSGYGLELEYELEQLQVLHEAKSNHPIDISVTYCGAHSIPAGKTAQEATEDVLNNQLPVLGELVKKNELTIDQIDVFCETGVFTTEQSRQILSKGKEYGFGINFHGDELSYTGSAEMGGELQAHAISHLEHISEQGMISMRDNESVAVLLPTTAYVLRITPPPARTLIEKGVIVALSTDFNPNAYCMSMAYVMNLACVSMKMNLNEALVASTINSAFALRKSEKHGSIAPGKYADLVVVDAPTWEHIIYQMGAPCIHHVFKKGKNVTTNNTTATQ